MTDLAAVIPSQHAGGFCGQSIEGQQAAPAIRRSREGKAGHCQLRVGGRGELVASQWRAFPIGSRLRGRCICHSRARRSTDRSGCSISRRTSLRTAPTSEASDSAPSSFELPLMAGCTSALAFLQQPPRGDLRRGLNPGDHAGPEFTRIRISRSKRGTSVTPTHA